MGRELREIRIVLSLSAHNSEQDRLDRAALANLRMELDALLHSDPAYEHIVLYTDSPE